MTINLKFQTTSRPPKIDAWVLQLFVLDSSLQQGLLSFSSSSLFPFPGLFGMLPDTELEKEVSICSPAQEGRLRRDEAPHPAHSGVPHRTLMHTTGNLSCCPGLPKPPAVVTVPHHLPEMSGDLLPSKPSLSRNSTPSSSSQMSLDIWRPSFWLVLACGTHLLTFPERVSLSGYFSSAPNMQTPQSTS